MAFATASLSNGSAGKQAAVSGGAISFSFLKPVVFVSGGYAMDTRIPNGLNSFLKASDKPRNANLEGLYEVYPMKETTAAAEATMTISPLPLAAICGAIVNHEYVAPLLTAVRGAIVNGHSGSDC